MVVKPCPYCRSAAQALIGNSKHTTQGIISDIECGLECGACGLKMTKSYRPSQISQFKANVHKQQIAMMDFITKAWNNLSENAKPKVDLSI